MDIKRVKYILKSDRWCYWIEEEYEYTDKKTKKTKTLTRNISGFYADIDQLANGFANHMIGDIEAKSLKKLLEQIQANKESVKQMVKDKVRELAD